MEEHQNNTDTHVQEDSSGDGTAKVIKAGSEAKPGRRVLRGGAGNNGNQADGSDHGITEAAPAEAAQRVVRAGQQALEDAEAVTAAAVDESTGGGRVLDEWASFVRRASLRNTQAVGELMHCYTVSSLLQWQINLLNATVIDVWGTNARILRSVTHKA
jgi:hypothetical protein